MRACDNGTPPKCAVQVSKVTVNRNLNCPNWRSGDKSVEIPETFDLGSEVSRVEAEDRDTQPPYNELRYQIVGDSLAQQFFVINTQSGIIYQRMALQHEPSKTTEYNVS